jgi:hypothetical protein
VYEAPTFASAYATVAQFASPISGCIRIKSIAHRFIRVVGHVDRAQFAGAMQPREHEAIPPVRFHPIAAPFRHHGGAHDHAVFPALGQVPIDAEAAGAGLVDEVELAVRRAERAHDLVERLEIARDHAVVADLAVAGTFRDGHVDRFLMDIQPYEHATVPHDLPPCGVVLLRSVRHSASSTT